MRNLPILHSDGTVSYRSHYCQAVIHRTDYVSPDELAVMEERDRNRIVAHLGRAQAQVEEEQLALMVAC